MKDSKKNQVFPSTGWFERWWVLLPDGTKKFFWKKEDAENYTNPK